jgi:hydroxyethylthiazole kinase-like uncharacterized protein yjeF
MRLPTRLLRRRVDSHKGDFGHILVLAGSQTFSGAAVLSAHAAIRTGAGLVTIGLPKSINNAIINIKPPEVMTLPLAETKDGGISIGAYKNIKDFLKKIDILVIGPGLGQNKSTQSLIRRLINKLDRPVVIDADGINALAGYLKVLRLRSWRHGAIVLTPHPGEMARLLGTTVKKIQKNRLKTARRFAKDYKLTLVLKGQRSIVVDYRGNKFLNSTGNAGMATAGSGDVLTGIIASFLAQGLDAFRAAKFAVYLHGLAGDMASKEKTQPGMIASDIIEKIPEAIKKMGRYPSG